MSDGSSMAFFRRPNNNSFPCEGTSFDSNGGLREMRRLTGLLLRSSLLLTLLPVPLRDTRRAIGITRRADSLASPGATILMEEISRRCPVLLASIDGKKAAASRRAR
jgi:hypothetical protein